MKNLVREVFADTDLTFDEHVKLAPDTMNAITIARIQVTPIYTDEQLMYRTRPYQREVTIHAAVCGQGVRYGCDRDCAGHGVPRRR